MPRRLALDATREVRNEECRPTEARDLAQRLSPSLTKAGKVKSQTPKIQGRERVSPIPRVRVRRNVEKRLILNRKPGQNWIRV